MSTRRKCLVHDMDLLPFICTDCKVVVCPTCIEVEHFGHGLVGTSSVAKTHRKQLEEALLNQENLSCINETSSNVQKSLAILNEHSSSIEHVINEEISGLINEMERCHKVRLDANQNLKDKYETPLKRLSKQIVQFTGCRETRDKETLSNKIAQLSDCDVVIMNIDLQNILDQDDKTFQFTPQTYTYSVKKESMSCEELMGSFVEDDSVESDYEKPIFEHKATKEDVGAESGDEDQFYDCIGYPVKIESRQIFDGLVDCVIPQSVDTILILSEGKLYQRHERLVDSGVHYFSVASDIKQVIRSKTGAIFVLRWVSETSYVERLLVDNRLVRFCEVTGTCHCIGTDDNGDVVVALKEDSGALRVFVFDKIGQIQHKDVTYLKKSKRVFNVIKSYNNKTIIAHEDKITFYRARLNFDHTYTGAIGYGYEARFCPQDICVDMRGNILVILKNENNVHLLDKNGKFIRLLLTEEDGLKNPVSLAFDNSGNLWIGSSDGHVLVLNYDIIYFSSRNR